tara:strand:+ start:116 stop:871 length:756 start_codon:yes stop_codon:yes gene_type:complete
MFFKNIKIIKYTQARNKVLFQCDEEFFNNWGIYNLLSCNEIGYDVHLHLINPSEPFLTKILNINLDIELSISTETLDTNINFYKLKSYYFVSRYYISSLLFDLDLVDKLYITDADIIFNEKLNMPADTTLGILYYPLANNLWKQTGANILFVTKQRNDYLKKVLADYEIRLMSTDFDAITVTLDKITKANAYALDQVCMSHVLKNEKDFLNLNSIDNFIGKDDSYKIWSLTGGHQKARDDIKEKLKLRFGV